MAPNQAPSSSAYESIDDYGNMYVEIMDLCRPFYSLKENGKQKSLPPRLDDALRHNQSGKNNPNITPVHKQASISSQLSCKSSL